VGAAAAAARGELDLHRADIGLGNEHIGRI
jgi:hypothetical protein